MIHSKKYTEEEFDVEGMALIKKKIIWSTIFVKRNFTRIAISTRHITKVYEKNGQVRKHPDSQGINKPLQNIKDLDEEEDSEHEYDPTNESDSEDESNQPCLNTETEKLLIEEECIKCSICDSTFCWQSGLRAHVKSMHTWKFKWEQCQLSFGRLEKLEEHIDYIYEENFDQSQVLEKPKCYECDWIFMNKDYLINIKAWSTQRKILKRNLM